ncbi:hypothetical protein V496_03715 [Pseudogymnoascus sp. VKM F-4515 (FW-2607)]|nr:hypothetical protein V496_03715 [Pseudogymnoascus sp. VKM F-4515 (FW-2607)]KFY91137.1 hypothetical protein V498_05643 [Pseudogymnoascus sp. VKM F-4517 (FW-2822)]
MLFNFSSRIVKRQLLSQIGAPSLINKAQNATGQCRPRFPSQLTRGCGASIQPIRLYSAATTDQGESQKRKNPRTPAVQRSLRRVAVEAERSSGDVSRGQKPSGDNEGLKSITAICVAEEFAMDSVVRILRSEGYPIDPQGTGFLDDQVVHTKAVNGGDVFIFPSGTIVSWSLPEDLAIKLATETLAPAATNPHLEKIEMEDLEYREDPTQDASSIKGEVITLGTKKEALENGDLGGKTSTTLAQIAFSSGLARSTKLAVLETSLTKYLDSTRTIPPILSRGGRLPFNKQFILKKTGALLELRAQLNHYSELTDSLPDLFWDSRHELGLEGYYDQVGRALDVNVRIKSLNAKMDYAHEIVSVLRETLSQSHSTWLEWIIIVLIAVEVGFELKREWKERAKAKAEAKSLQ